MLRQIVFPQINKKIWLQDGAPAHYARIVIALHHHVVSTLDKENVAGVMLIAYDFSKAFDRLKHDVIVEKLRENDFSPSLTSWIANYLHERRQYVKLGTSVSCPLIVTSGVPQGSILGPYFFFTGCWFILPQSSRLSFDKICRRFYSQFTTL